MQEASFNINILQVGQGDCIHLRFCSEQKWYNIVIDSGPAEKKGSAEEFANLMLKIRDSGECVDLLCFSHIDDDHIKAAERFFEADISLGAAEYIKQVWINIPEYETDKLKPKKPNYIELLTPEAAMDLCGYLLWHKIPCCIGVPAGVRLQFGDVLIRTVLPTPARLAEYEAWWRKKDQKKVVQLAAESSDDNPANGSSIAIIVQVCGKKLLFCGDAFAPDLEEASIQWAGDGFDLVKLPHHGSKANITKEMLEAMKCSCFVISANGKRKRPSQQTVDILGQYGQAHEGINLYGNYPWEVREKEGVKIHTLDRTPVFVAEDISIRTESMK